MWLATIQNWSLGLLCKYVKKHWSTKKTNKEKVMLISNLRKVFLCK